MTAEATSKEAEYKHRGLNFMSASTLHAIAFAATHDLYGGHLAAHSSSVLHLGNTYEYERFRVALLTDHERCHEQVDLAAGSRRRRLRIIMPRLAYWAYAHGAVNVMGGLSYFCSPIKAAGLPKDSDRGVILRIEGLGHSILLIAGLMLAVPRMEPRSRAIVAGLLAANDAIMFCNVLRAFIGGFKGDDVYSPALLGVVALEGMCFGSMATVAARQAGGMLSVLRSFLRA